MLSFAKFLWRVKIHLACTAAVVVGLVIGLKAVLPARAGSVGAAEKDTAGWPMFRGSAARLGAAPGAKGPTEAAPGGGPVWNFKEEKTFYSTPTVVGNRVYATSADKGVFADKGTIYCFDADTGGTVWKFRPPGFRATFSSPSVAGKYLVVGEGLHETHDARIFCLDISGKEPKVLWEHRTANHVESSGCIVLDKDGKNGRAYIGAGDDGYYCFELEPVNGKPKMVWHTSPKEMPDCETCPAAVDDKVYVGLGMSGNAVVCLDAATGKEIWRTSTPYPVFTPPSVAEGKVFIGMGNGNFIEEAEEVMAKEVDRMRKAGKSAAEIEAAKKTLGPAGEVWCLDANKGNILWKKKVGRTVLGAVAATKDRIFFGSRDKNFYCLSHDGRELNKWSPGESIVTCPSVTEQYVYFVTETGGLYALDIETFERVWTTKLGTEGPYLSSPTAARGHVYVGSTHDGLLCLGKPGTRQKKIENWAGHLGGPGKGGALAEAPLPLRGTTSWRFPTTQGSTEAIAGIVAPVAAMGDRIFVPMASGQRMGLACLKNDADALTTRALVELWSIPTSNGVKLSPAANEDTVFFVDGAKGDNGRLLRAADHAGKIKWSQPIAADAFGQFALCGNMILVQDRPGTLSAYTAAGKPIWSQPIGTLCQSALVQGSIVVAAIESPQPALMALDRDSGVTLWSISLASAPRTGPGISYMQKDRIYLGTAKGMACHSLVDGSVVWQSEAGAVENAFVFLRNQVAYTSSAGELVFVDSQGQTIAKLAGAMPSVPPLRGRGGVIYATSEGLMTVAIPEPSAATTQPTTAPAIELKPASWLKLSDWLGTVSSPMVLLESQGKVNQAPRVLFATNTGGLVCAIQKK